MPRMVASDRMGARPRAAPVALGRGAGVVPAGAGARGAGYGAIGAHWLRSLTSYPAFVNRPRWWHWADRAVGWALALCWAAAMVAEAWFPRPIVFECKEEENAPIRAVLEVFREKR